MIRDNNRSGGGFLSFSRKRLMSTTVEEFEELLHVEQQIDVGRLSTAAAHGIPESVFGQLIPGSSSCLESITWDSTVQLRY
jgi:hypothetical protein